MSDISHSIVICTQGRSNEFVMLLDCLNIISHEIAIELVVVANSNTAADNNKIEVILNNYKEFALKKYLVSAPGLPRSRNLGKRYLRGKYVTFLDDDTEIASSYFKSIEKLFDSDQKLVGIAPYIEVDPTMWNFGNSQRKKLSQNKKSAGKISGFGKFSWIEFADSCQLVEWLPGCAMSYRLEVLQQVEFNEDLENGITGGYALGEDADFSMKVGKIGKLVGISSESVLHKLSPISRASAKHMEMARGSWLAYLTREFPSKFSSTKILFRLILNFIAVFLGINTKAGLSRLSFESASLRIKGFIYEKRNPKLIVKTSR